MDSKFLKIFIIGIVLIVLMVPLSGCTSPSANVTATPTAAASATAAPTVSITLATTTSMQDTGLLDYLLPDFEKQNNVNVKVVAKGSGDAMMLGQTGDADVLIVHSPAAEDVFMKAGYGWNRTQFAHNYFVIVGPATDPAKINGSNATAAFKKIYLSNSTFVGRGDNSGTAAKELDIWNKTGLAQPNNKTFTWYKSTGSGMADTLRIADQMGAYTLSDKSTYLKNQKNLSLVILVENSTEMLNKYDIITLNQTMHPNTNYGMAVKLTQYLSSQPVQQKIATYGQDKYGQPLFFADLLNKTA